MSASETSLAASLRLLAQTEQRANEPHPDADALLDYHAGRLSDQDRERVQEHLVGCGACSDAVLDMARFPTLEPTDRSRAISDEDLATEWQAMQRRLEQHRPSDGVLPFPGDASDASAAGPRSAPASSLPQTLAALFLAACLALTWWILALRQEIDTLRSPRVNPAFRSLFATDHSGSRSGDATAEAPPGLPAGQELNLALVHVDAEPAKTYRVELENDEGVTIWQNDQLRAPAERPFRINFSADFLSPGRYLLKLYDPEAPERLVLNEYPFLVD